ncbi:AAA family ATPase [Aliamphritea ceti]|uniref:AAA family ATPase n=1 Tax=Aliamphritea ceti TaxID=1524258 RepID=UPI0021C40988|nr:AAA family ATPase [Aliamphritea ceti]
MEMTLAARLPKNCLEMAEVGSLWAITGERTQREYRINGILIKEELIDVDTATLLKPSGELIARWISGNVEGIGDVLARRLVRAIPDLNEKVSLGDVEALTRVQGFNEGRAKALIAKWPSEGLYAVLEWLQGSSLPLSLAERLIRVYNSEALIQLKTNPFILAAFGVSFEKILGLVDKLNLKVSNQDLIAAIAEHVTSKYCYRTGSTLIPKEKLLTDASVIAKDVDISADSIIEDSLKKGVLLETPYGYQTLGSAIQEHAVARFISKAASREPGDGSLLSAWEKNLTDNAIEQALLSFETTLPFKMTAEQREAVKNAVSSPVSVISGGAGTGKTTILLAMLSIYEQLSDGMYEYQAALSGRAAQRMSESTGRPAFTIAKLISDHIGEKKQSMPDHLLLVIDEASMVDLLTMYKLVGVLPYATRIVMVGDVAQLPPVGSGLIFHAVMKSPLPVYELTQVKRQGQDSGIHQLATSIRENDYHHGLLNSDSGDCVYSADSSHERIIAEWEKAGGSQGCILLTPTRKGPLGVDNLNKLIQAYRDEKEVRPEIHYQDGIRGWIPWITRTGAVLRLDDQIMVTSNDYTTGIRNGDLGSITSIYKEPDEDGVVAQMDINGEIIDITYETLEILDLGYAITIHKSQGSQWPTCILILPGYVSHMLDQTLLYTAVTRPSDQLVILGHSSLVTNALRRGSIALQRITNIENLLISAI